MMETVGRNGCRRRANSAIGFPLAASFTASHSLRRAPAFRRRPRAPRSLAPVSRCRSFRHLNHVVPGSSRVTTSVGTGNRVSEVRSTSRLRNVDRYDGRRAGLRVALQLATDRYRSVHARQSWKALFVAAERVRVPAGVHRLSQASSLKSALEMFRSIASKHSLPARGTMAHRLWPRSVVAITRCRTSGRTRERAGLELRLRSPTWRRASRPLVARGRRACTHDRL